MSNEMKRMHYFNGLLLKEEDLSLDQEYHKRLRRIHNYHFHNWGIVYGLEVEVIEKTLKVKVSQGMALNRVLIGKSNEAQSQEIWICDNHPDNPVDLASYKPGDDIYITVIYDEIESDIDAAKGGLNKIHVWERARINHRKDLPNNSTEEIILARVQLGIENGVMFIKEKSYFAKDNITELRTYAMPKEEATTFKKISVGPKNGMNLPYITSFGDEDTIKGVEIHSTLTKFSGTLVSGGLNVEGDVDIKGAVNVTSNNQETLKIDSKGNMEVSKLLDVKDRLSAQNGLYVGGDNINIDTSKVLVKSNTLTINNYDKNKDESLSRELDSGIDVYRGGTEPNAKLVWSGKENVWKAGIAGSAMYPLAYGEDWNKLHKGQNADELHKHRKLYDAHGNVKLSIDDNGNIDVSQSILVSGNILANGGIEVSRPKDFASARLVWNEDAKHWQVGDKDEMVNLIYGKEWEELITGTNADSRHSHSRIYTEDGKALAVRVNPNGNVDVASDLTVGKNLTVVGDFTVKGKNSVITTEKLEVTDNVIVVNTHQKGGEPISQSGIEVYRGGEVDNARIIWDEGSRKWKIGIGKDVATVPAGNQWEELTNGGVVEKLHKHNVLHSRNGVETLSVLSDRELKADSNLSVTGELKVEKNATVKGNLGLNGSIIVDGDLTVKGTTTTVNKKNLEVDDNIIIVNRYPDHTKPLEEGGLEVYRGGVVPNARIVWNESEGKWKFGVGNNTVELPNADGWQGLTKQGLADKLHKHSMICDGKGNSILGVSESSEVDIKGDTKVDGKLSVNGTLIVSGDIDVKGSVTAVKRVDMKVTDNLITLNNFEGDAPKLNESGIEIFRGNKKDKARLIWDEVECKWKLGLGTEVKEIVCGDQWDNLINRKNADGIHLHGQLYNSQGDILGLSISSRGNVDVAHALSVGHDLAVLGNLEVKGSLASFNTDMFEVRGNSIIVNRYETNTVSAKALSGLKVFRGMNNPFAGVMWDETIGAWKIGVLDGNEGLIVKNDGSLLSLGKVQAKSAEYTEGIKAYNGEFLGTINAKSANINGDLISKNGIKVVRSQEYEAYVKWEEELKHWKIGTSAGKGLIVKEDGKVGIGTITPESNFDVKGTVLVSDSVKIGENSVINKDSIKTLALNIEKDLKVGEKAEIEGVLIAKNCVLKEDINVLGNLFTKSGIEVKRLKQNGDPDDSAKIIWKEDQNKWYFGKGEDLSPLMISQSVHDRLLNPKGNDVAVWVDDSGYVGIGISKPQAKLHVSGKAQIDGDVISKGSIKGNDGYFEGKVGIGTETPLAKLHVSESIQIDENIKVEGNVIAGGNVAANNGTISGNHGLFSGNLKVNGNFVSENGIEVSRIEGKNNKLPSAKIIWNKDDKEWMYGIEGELYKFVNPNHKHNTLFDSSKEARISVTVNDKGNVGIGTDKPLEKLHVSGNVQVDGSTTFIGDIISKGDIMSNNGTISGKNGLFKSDLKVNGNLVSGNGIEVTMGDDKLPSPKIIWSKADNAWVYGVGDNLDKLIGSKHKHNTLCDSSKEEKISVIVNDKGNVGIGTDTPLAKLHVSEGVQVDGSITSKGDVTSNGNITSNNGTISGKNGLFKSDLKVNGNLVSGNGIEVTMGDDKLPSPKIIWSKADNAWVYGVGDNLDKLVGSKHKHNTLYDSSKEEKVSVTVNDKGNVGMGTDNPLAKLHVSGDGLFNGKITGKSELEIGTNALVINKDGNIGMGKKSEVGFRLDVDGSVRVGTLTQSSSKDNSENIEEFKFEKAVEVLNALKPVLYDCKTEGCKKHNIGFIAENVPTILASSDQKSVALMDIIGVLTTVVKKQSDELLSMNNKILELQQKIVTKP